MVFKALFIVWLRWLREDTSNMAVIDVKLVSGYQVDEESLDRVSLHFLTNVEFQSLQWRDFLFLGKESKRLKRARTNERIKRELPYLLVIQKMIQETAVGLKQTMEILALKRAIPCENLENVIEKLNFMERNSHRVV